ncbi:MobF family relaxase [Kibdelosporangium phytohabitans]|uniref:TrwC relaxase domain-containing protein n=1 Tax=Kibdelosporangium phytohabitans TaxID=860235 RepID=A0A0N7F2N8_9PSEU|nr:MobF family relaxase [Kibdelosporangium phytohabitans]ALG06351.1 hypothetical protein AOZ06_04920 [Kibdelosporangium phytohabitans]MBE1467490.1 conjugative relaxase-like TrwC/TraI family protein [Kibdelosporangium phytohabitans]
MTCHKLTAGDGYTYLTRQVAAGDVAPQARASSDLAAYYQATGNPPGIWVGSGCEALGVDGIVTEDQMQALFGEALHPDAAVLIAEKIKSGVGIDDAIKAARLGRRYALHSTDIPLVAELSAAYKRFEEANKQRPTVAERRQIKFDTAHALLVVADPAKTYTPEDVRRYITDELGRAKQAVAGFDLVFTPSKSISVLWGLSTSDIRDIVTAAHDTAWRDALAYIEREAAFTRVGAGGIAQVDTHGLVATAFTHFDSRAGDPNLHTHVAVANRVLAEDGIWRTLDGQQLYRIAVSASEYYNARIEEELIDQLGVRFVEHSRGPDKRPVREIEGIHTELIEGFSQRRTGIEATYDRLVAEYISQHGSAPPRTVQIKLAQQACLEDRPDKENIRPLADQIEEWLARAEYMLPDHDIHGLMAATLHRGAGVALVDDLSEIEQRVAELADKAIDTISATRSTWTVYHVRAEVLRTVRGTPFPTTDDRLRFVESVVEHALGTASIQLDVQPESTPMLLQRKDGEIVFRRHGSERYTSTAILDAEDKLLQDADIVRGARVPAPMVDLALRDTGVQLDPGQRQVVKHFVSCGRALAVAVGPPGAGKSTAMRSVRDVWETAGHRVVGLAPTAVGAAVLSQQLDVPATTLDGLITAHRHNLPLDLRPNDMLLVDEAGLAGTLLLAELSDIAAEHQAIIRLIGDYKQLGAVEAGGALRLLATETDAAELTQVHRFNNPDEAVATLRLRDGDPSVSHWYETHHRLVGGVRPAVLDQLYSAWKLDQSTGATSIMISDRADIVRELSVRAQLDRRAWGAAEASGVPLHDGTQAGVGDLVVTRLNNRTWQLFGGKDFVKNGDVWVIAARDKHGQLTVQHVEHGGTVTLPADYVAESVELGYALTIHRAQGLTVDICRAHLSPSATRELATVALTRGRDSNVAYLETDQVIYPDEPNVLPGDLYWHHRNTTATQLAFEAIIAKEGSEYSATEQLRDALDYPSRLSVSVPEYEYALHIHRGPDANAQAAQWVQDGMPDYAGDILADSAWPALANALHELKSLGHDPAAVLAKRAAYRELDTAVSVAQVMHWRVIERMPAPDPDASGRPVGLPDWVPTPPAPDSPIETDPHYQELGTWLRHKAFDITQRVSTLTERVTAAQPEWAHELGPAPDDPLARADWEDRAGQIAAYRERWQVPDTDRRLLGSDDLVGVRKRHYRSLKNLRYATVSAQPATTRHSPSSHEPTIDDLEPTPHGTPSPQDPDPVDRLNPIDEKQHTPNDRVPDAEADAGDDNRSVPTPPSSGADGVAHWSRRPYGELDDHVLNDQIRQQQTHLDRATRAQTSAAEHASRLRDDVEARRGPAVTAAHANLAQLRDDAQRALEANEAEAAWHKAVRQAQLAAAEQADIDDQLATRRLTRSRHVDLENRRAELVAEHDEAQQRARDIAARARELHRLTGPAERRMHTLDQAAQAEADIDRAQWAAQRADQQATTAAERRATRLTGQRDRLAQYLHDLQNEQRVREDMPEDVREHERSERHAATMDNATPGTPLSPDPPTDHAIDAERMSPPPSPRPDEIDL